MSDPNSVLWCVWCGGAIATMLCLIVEALGHRHIERPFLVVLIAALLSCLWFVVLPFQFFIAVRK